MTPRDPLDSTPRPYDVLAMGRSCIDLYAHEIGVPITDVSSFDAYVGGCPTNISVGTRRLGLRSALLTAVGDDQVGEFVTAFLEREQVDTRFIPRKPGRRTSAVMLTIQPPDSVSADLLSRQLRRPRAHDRRCRAGADRREPRRVPDRHRPEPRAGRAATFAAAAAARDAGVPVVVDIDYRADQWDSAAAFAAQVQTLLRSATLAVGTEEELAAASGTPDVAGGTATILRRGIRGAGAEARRARIHGLPPRPRRRATSRRFRSRC